ncbi:MAG: SDR family NAD(P)-dependent oxidoreductase [Anaerolineae bacterium]
MRLLHRVAIVTGAGSGIGRAIALRLAEEGARVVVAELVASRGGETAALIEASGGAALPLTVDVSQRADVERLVQHTLDTWGQLDILVNNAGLLGRVPLLDLTDAQWDRMMAVNLRGPFLCAQAAARVWIEAGRGGSLINIASIESAVAFPDQVHYAASKGGVLMMTRALALDLARYGIRVNAIGPGTTDSGHGSFDDPVRRASYEARIPLGRVGRPRDIANAALFLASDEAAYITGEILYVDGGYLIE